MWNHEEKDLSVAILTTAVGENKIYRLISEENMDKNFTTNSKISPIFDAIISYPIKTTAGNERRQLLLKAISSKQMEAFL